MYLAALKVLQPLLFPLVALSVQIYRLLQLHHHNSLEVGQCQTLHQGQALLLTAHLFMLLHQVQVPMDIFLT